MLGAGATASKVNRSGDTPDEKPTAFCALEGETF
jgi:hypothetical protein